MWTLTTRSVVRKRHRLQRRGGDVWTFETPFYWWQHLTGALRDTHRLVGEVGPSTRQWGFVLHPQQDDAEVLAAVAFMHWKWWRW